MKELLFLISIFCALETNAQVYLISFAGAGESTTVGSVKVENMTAGTSLMLSGGNVLRLNILTEIEPVRNKQSSELKIYPNPATGNSVLQIYPPAEGNADIKVFDLAGREVAQMRSYLENSMQEFRLSGLQSGFYMISVTGNSYSLSGKLISNGNPSGQISVGKLSYNLTSEEKASENRITKGIQDFIDMTYTVGDRIKYTGISGNYSTVKTDIPEGDKTITFHFIACSDGENNNYPVVEIGTQVWMAENLKTIKFNDGTAISLVTDAGDWNGLSTPGYCWYNNDAASYKATYGALYNWYAVITNKLCPIGWHVPDQWEGWETLITYIGDKFVAGGKLKETGTIHWQSPNTGATNESGFTALPGGIRSGDGFHDIGRKGRWWVPNEGVPPYADAENMNYDNSSVEWGFNGKGIGFSVRCLKN